MKDFASIQEDINWARARIDEAETKFRVYLESDPVQLVTEIDPATGDKTHKIKLIREPANDIKHLFRNALLDIKHSFDRSLNAAARAHGCEKFSGNFPWTDSLGGLKSTLRKRQKDNSKALPKDILREIFRQYPYYKSIISNKGQDIVRDLSRLANEKHAIGFETFIKLPFLNFKGGEFIDTTIFVSSWDRNRREMVIGRSSQDEYANFGDVKITAIIAFDYNESLSQIPAALALRHFADRAESCLEDMRRVSSH